MKVVAYYMQDISLKMSYYKYDIMLFKVPPQQTEESELGHVDSLQRSALVSYHEFQLVQCCWSYICFSELFVTWTDWKHLWKTWTRGRPEQRMMGQIVQTLLQLISPTGPESINACESEISKLSLFYRCICFIDHICLESWFCFKWLLKPHER